MVQIIVPSIMIYFCLLYYYTSSLTGRVAVVRSDILRSISLSSSRSMIACFVSFFFFFSSLLLAIAGATRTRFHFNFSTASDN